MRATRASFQTEPPPARRARLNLYCAYSPDQMERIRDGFVPQSSDDRWFIYYENGVLHLHRSWTGNQIFELQFEESGDGSAELIGGWVSRDVSQYNSDDFEEDVMLAADLIDTHLLRA